MTRLLTLEGLPEFHGVARPRRRLILRLALANPTTLLILLPVGAGVLILAGMLCLILPVTRWLLGPMGVLAVGLGVALLGTILLHQAATRLLREGVRSYLKQKSFRGRLTQCPECGYDQRGHQRETCPECGNPVALRTLPWPVSPRRQRAA